MKKSTIGAMLVALLLGSFALAYGVGEASAQLSSRQPRAALAHEEPTSSPTPATSTSTEPTPAVKPPPKATPSPTPGSTPKPKPSPKPSPKPKLHAGRTLLGPQTSGDEVRDLQARLKQIAWYFGDVTGTYDAGHRRARSRASRPSASIPVTGEVDQRTLDRLHAMTAHARPHDELHNIAAGSPAHARRRAASPAACSASTRPAAPCAGWSTARCRRRSTRASARRQYTPTREGAVPRLPEGRATTSRSSTARRCRTRCSSPAARPCTTPRTSRPAATTAPRTAA